VRRLLQVGVAAALLVAGAAGAEEGTFARAAHAGRAYRLYVPAGAATAPRALVVALHGCFQTPEDLALGTRLNEAAARRGLLVLYPAQSPADNPSRCWNWFEPANQGRRSGEVAEILAIVADVTRTHAVARGRTIVLGLSAGGFMAVNLLCAAPDVVAGVGVVAGGPYRCGVGEVGALQCMRGHRLDGAASAAACLAASGTPSVEARASLWQGAEDTVVAPASLTALETMMVRLAGTVSATTERQEGALRSVWRDGDGRAVLETWLVPGLGHAWSGGDLRGTHASPHGPDATTHILDFLLEPSAR